MKTLRERLEEIRPLLETTEGGRKLIMSGIITGSLAFGVAREDSDIDVIVKNDEQENLFCYDLFSCCITNCNGLYLYGSQSPRDGVVKDHYYTDGFYTCYLLMDNKLYNLIIPHNEHYYKEWKYATEKMIELCKDSEYREFIKDKKIRVEQFEMYKKVGGSI